MKIAIVCYASIGGSGIVATELAKCLAARGHQVHVVSREQPFRLGDDQPGVVFHRVVTPSYPLFREPQYVLSLATAIAQISRAVDLDIIHAHYAIPHATAAYLARQILDSTGGPTPKVVTTLHGTDITIVGSDPSYAETIGFSIEQSDGVTAVSESLKADTYRGLPVTREIRVIPNFLDCRIHHRVPAPGMRERFAGAGEASPQAGSTDASPHAVPGRAVVMHMSNFRPVKRIPAVIEVFARIRAAVPSVLLLVGDGPDLPHGLALAKEMGIAPDVISLGEQEDVRKYLSIADLFLLPSATESFGLSALEAMACEVPVIASRVGGLPEVIDDGVTGFLHAPEDLAGMAASGIEILTDASLRERLRAAGRRLVHERFCADRIVPLYEAFYREVMGR